MHYGYFTIQREVPQCYPEKNILSHM